MVFVLVLKGKPSKCHPFEAKSEAHAAKSMPRDTQCN